MQIAHEIGSRNNAFCVMMIFHSAMIVKPVQLLFPFTYLTHLQQTNSLILEQYLLNIMPILSDGCIGWILEVLHFVEHDKRAVIIRIRYHLLQYSLSPKKALFNFHTAGIPTQAVSRNHSMTGNDYREGIGTNCIAHGSCGM